VLARVFEAAAGLGHGQAQLVELLVYRAVAVGALAQVRGRGTEVGRVSGVAGGLAHGALLPYSYAQVDNPVAIGSRDAVQEDMEFGLGHGAGSEWAGQVSTGC
jgi:hypothetical protein